MMRNEENKTLYDIYRGILCNNQSFQLGKQAQVEYRFDCPEYAELKENIISMKLPETGQSWSTVCGC